MRYAAIVAASAAVVAVLVLPRDGRGEAPGSTRQAALASALRVAAEPMQLSVRGGGAQQEDFRWSGRIARGDEIEIRNLLGDVRAEVTSGDQVEVVGRRIGEDARHVRIEVVESADGVVICAVYPRSPHRGNDDDGDRSSGRTRRGGNSADDACEHGQGDEEIDLDDEARIEFTVRVPAGVKFAARVVDGDILAEGLRSDVDAATVSGNVRVATTGTANAASVSGNVDATFGETGGDEMTFASVSGDVTVRLAGGVGAEVEANTLSGDIESDFDLRMGSMTGDDDDEDEDDDDDDDGFHIDINIGRHASGTIGGGGPELSLNTVSGNIRLRRAR
jgi:hypothetical protein